MTAIFIKITATRGSTPRETGTVMMVNAQTTEGTIGGGALEFKAIAKARDMLAKGHDDHEITWPLGPGLGQCCGGAVTLHFGRSPHPTDAVPTAQRIPATAPGELWVWGAGHVGRAVVNASPCMDITWIDSAHDRFPATIPGHVTAIPCPDMPRLARQAPRAAQHLIFTYAHDIDLALCAALIARGTSQIGLIGSATKWARFQSRLRGMGLDPAGITCPIGDKSLGKRPDQIARGVVAALIAQEAA